MLIDGGMKVNQINLKWLAHESKKSILCRRDLIKTDKQNPGFWSIIGLGWN